MVSEMEYIVNHQDAQEATLGRPLTQDEQFAIGQAYEDQAPDMPDDLKYYTNGGTYSFADDSILGEHKFAILGILGAVLAFGLISKI